jgi:hypothetical protein
MKKRAGKEIILTNATPIREEMEVPVCLDVGRWPQVSRRLPQPRRKTDSSDGIVTGYGFDRCSRFES